MPANVNAFVRWYTDDEITRLTRYQPGPMHNEEIERFFASRVLGADALAFAVHVRANDRLIGTCALSQVDGDNGSALYHITIGERDAWGLGYGTEATDLILKHAFDHLGLHRVALSVFAFNDRAIRSYRKSGFAVEGRSREAIWRDGRFWDEVQMGILEGDWRAFHRRKVGRTDETAALAPAFEAESPAPVEVPLTFEAATIGAPEGEPARARP